MVAGHTWANPFFTPTVFRLVDSAKPRFILEHQANSLSTVENFQILYRSFNFFEAAMPSSLAFWGVCCGALPYAIHDDAEQNIFDRY